MLLPFNSKFNELAGSCLPCTIADIFVMLILPSTLMSSIEPESLVTALISAVKFSLYKFLNMVIMLNWLWFSTFSSLENAVKSGITSDVRSKS